MFVYSQTNWKRTKILSKNLITQQFRISSYKTGFLGPKVILKFFPYDLQWTYPDSANALLDKNILIQVRTIKRNWLWKKQS